MLIRKFKYYQWYPSLICVIAQYISFTFQLVFSQQLKHFQENNPSDPVGFLQKKVLISDFCKRASSLLFSLTLIPGLLNFKYYIVSLFFLVQSIIAAVVYFYIYFEYDKSVYQKGLFLLYVDLPYIITPVVLPLEAIY